MSNLTTLSDILNLATTSGGAPEEIVFGKSSVDITPAAQIANQPMSLWRYAGKPSNGVAPGSTGLNPDNTTDGGLKQTDPANGKQKWIIAAQACPNGQAVVDCAHVLLYDRLMHVSGLSGTSTSVQSFSGGSVSRYTGTVSKGNQIWVEIYTQIGVSTQTLTINFTNESNVASTATVSVGNTGFREASRLIPVVFGAADYGVRSIQSVQLGGSTGTAGDFGVTIVRPLIDIPMSAPITGLATVDTLSAASLGGGTAPGIEVMTDACLAMVLTTNTTGLRVQGSVYFVEK